MVWGTDVLDAVVGAAGVSQTEVHGQLSHDAGGRDFTVDGVGDDRGTQGHHSAGFHLPVGEVRTGLVLQELDAVVGVQEAGDADDVNGIGFGHAFLNFLGSPTGVADAGAQSTIGDVTGAEEGFEFRRRGGPHGAAGVPANGAGGACFSRNGQSSEGCTSKQASSETRKHGTTNKHVNKKSALSIRNADIT